MIELDDVHKRFGPKIALAALAFEAPDGCVTGLLGPNGAGKTTALRILSGLMQPDRGRATIDGHDVHTQTRTAHRRLGVLPDAQGLYPRLTGREHLRYFGALHGLGRRQVDDAAERLDTLLGLGELLDRRAQGLSQGERKKLALARALLHDPQNVLLDEPENGLDVTANRGLRTLIVELRRQGKCVVLSSHRMNEVALLCDRLVLVARGRAAASGTPAQLLEQTGKSDLEAAFIELVGEDGGKP